MCVYLHICMYVQSTPFITLKLQLGSVDVSALSKKRLIKVMFYNENN